MSKLKVNNLDTHTGPDILVHKNLKLLSSSLSADGNVHVGGNLNVVGTATISGGTVQLGDAATDNVIFGADVQSNVLPDSPDTYNLGSAGKRWNEAHVKTANMHDTNITGDLDVAGTAVVSGAGTVHGATDLKSTLAVGSDATISGNTTISGNLDVAGNENLTGDLDVTGSAVVSGAGTVHGAADLKSTLDVTGASTLASTLAVGSSASVTGKLTVGGDEDVGGNLHVTGTGTVTGSAYLMDKLQVDGAANLTNTLGVSGDTTIGSDTYLQGELDVSGGAVVDLTLTVKDDTELQQALDVTGIGTFTGQTIHNGGIDVNGVADISEEMTVSGAAVLKNNLDVDGATTLKDNFKVKTASDENRFEVYPGGDTDNAKVEIKSDNQDTRIYLEAAGDSYMSTGTFTIGDTTGSAEKLTIVGNASASGTVYANHVQSSTISATSITADDVTVKNDSFKFDSGALISSNTAVDVVINGPDKGMISPLLSTAPLTANMFVGSQVAYLSGNGGGGYDHVLYIKAADGALLQSINWGAITTLAAAPAAPVTYNFAQQIGFETTAITSNEGISVSATLTRTASGCGTAGHPITTDELGALSGAVTAQVYTYDGTATSGTDYESLSVTDVTFAHGVSSVTIPVLSTFTDGSFAEADQETFFIAVSSAVAADHSGTDWNQNVPAGGDFIRLTPVTITPADSAEEVTIQDLDLWPNQSIQFTSSGQSIAEPGTGFSTGSATVTRTGDNADYGDVNVNYVITTTATDTASIFDFTPRVGSVLFADGETSKTVTFTVTADGLAEDDETFRLILQDPPVVLTQYGSAGLGATDTHFITILSSGS